MDAVIAAILVVVAFCQGKLEIGLLILANALWAVYSTFQGCIIRDLEVIIKFQQNLLESQVVHQPETDKEETIKPEK